MANQSKIPPYDHVQFRDMVDDQHQSPLFKVPTELRLQIYREIFMFEKPVNILSQPEKCFLKSQNDDLVYQDFATMNTFLQDLKVLLLCKRVWVEGRGLPFEINTFAVTLASDEDDLETVGGAERFRPRQLQFCGHNPRMYIYMVRKLRVDAHFSYYSNPHYVHRAYLPNHRKAWRRGVETRVARRLTALVKTFPSVDTLLINFNTTIGLMVAPEVQYFAKQIVEGMLRSFSRFEVSGEVTIQVDGFETDVFFGEREPVVGVSDTCVQEVIAAIKRGAE